MGSRVRIRLLHILHFVMIFLCPLLKNSKSGVDDRGHRLRITHTHRRERKNSQCTCVKNLRDRIIGHIAKNYYAPLGKET